MTLIEATEFLAPCKLDHESPSVWTDLGCGSGLFTYALAALLLPGSHIYAIDKQSGFVQRENQTKVEIDTFQVDFVHDELPFSAVRGILMANSLHYVKDKAAFLREMKKYLPADGTWVIIEYDTKKANPWVPYPVNFESLQKLFLSEGYKQIVKKSERPSRYNSANMYCAMVNR